MRGMGNPKKTIIKTHSGGPFTHPITITDTIKKALADITAARIRIIKPIKTPAAIRLLSVELIESIPVFI